MHCDMPSNIHPPSPTRLHPRIEIITERYTAYSPDNLYMCTIFILYMTVHTCFAHVLVCVQVQQLVTGSTQETTTHRKVQHMHTTLNDIRSTITVLEANLGTTMSCMSRVHL